MYPRPVPMTFDEFKRLPRRVGWKHEYIGGNAYFQPRHSIAIVRTETVPRPVSIPDGFTIRPATPDDAARLIPAFFDAFRHSVDYWGYNRLKIRDSARDSIQTCFAGRRGDFHPASYLAVAPTGRSVAGAALIVRGGEAPNLDLLFVRPRWQRLGLATALVQTAVNDLHGRGETPLDSGHVVANRESAAWHSRFGFTELPDLGRAKEQYHDVKNELQRRELIGDVCEAEWQAMEAEAARWLVQIKELEAVAARDGYDAVFPLRRLHRAQEQAS